MYVDELLAKNEEIYFDAGTHKGAIKLRYQDFADRVHPQVAEFHREPSSMVSMVLVHAASVRDI